MTTHKDEFRCGVCRKLYTHPVFHIQKPCGVSFDRQCIGKICPAQDCGQIINEDDLVVNYTLLKIVDEHRFKLEVPRAYYLILLDTSTSMWYSDAWLSFAIGESRFSCAIQFLSGFLNLHMNSMTDKISLVTFATSPLQRFDFETIKETHLTTLQSIKCDGKDTALFDSIDFCLTKLENLKKILEDEMPTSYLVVITDGGSNFGREQSEHAREISWRSGKLQISGHMIQIGDTDRKKTRKICDFIKFKYNYFNSGNVNEFVDSFTSSIKTETRARVAQARVSQARTPQTRSMNNADALLIDQLPDVPTEPVKVPSKQKVLA